MPLLEFPFCILQLQADIRRVRLGSEITLAHLSIPGFFFFWGTWKPPMFERLGTKLIKSRVCFFPRPWTSWTTRIYRTLASSSPASPATSRRRNAVTACVGKSTSPSGRPSSSSSSVQRSWAASTTTCASFGCSPDPSSLSDWQRSWRTTRNRRRPLICSSSGT